ncbi:MAG TPA: LacI family DNA-binding transcriptional regulator [Ilumatobacter sp.]|nr:LacI family DNA-binding transcriptional regulator [Ilumatobacter sp.]
MGDPAPPPDRPGRRVTLLTIANEVGVSRTTVSNAYSRPDQLTKELRDRIMDAAERLGYRGPSAAGRLLRTGRVGTLGLVFTDHLGFVFSDPNTTLFMRGVAEATAAAHVGLTLLPVPRDAEPDELSLLNIPVDGYIVFSIADTHPVFEALIDRRDVPLVVIDEPDPGDRCAFVGVDDRDGARQVAAHIAGLGHTRVAILAHRLTDTPTRRPVTAGELADAPLRVARQRYAGYLDGLGPGVDVRALWEAGELTTDAGRAAATDVYRAHPDITALLCMTDQLAIGACQAFERMGVDVPGQVSVAGYDDIPRASAWSPGLTTMRQPLLDKGRIAAGLLLDQLDATDGDERPARIELPIELVVRASTGPAPAA